MIQQRPADEIDGADVPFAEAWPVLEYDTHKTHSAAQVVRGVGYLLIAAGATGFVTEAIGVIGALVSGGVSLNWFTGYMVAQSASGGLIYLLYGLGGLFCLRRRAVAANFVCAGAIVSMLSSLSIWPMYLYFAWGGGGNGPFANRLPLSQLGGFGYQVLRVLPTLLLPLLLLWLFTRPLIRDAIGVK